MSIFDNFTTFLESKLDEFLQNNPQLNLTILAQEIKQEKQDTIKIISQLETKQKKLETEILKLVQDIKLWCERIEKAEKAKRIDLAQEAEQRKNLLLSQGNIAWQEMKKVKAQIANSKQKMINIEQKEREINLKIQELEKTKYQREHYSKTSTDSSYSNNSYYNFNEKNYDDLEKKFRDWEVSMELEEMKRKMNS